MQLLDITWLDELLCFVDTFLDSSIHGQEIVEETLVWLVDSGFSIKKGRRAAFRYAGLKCLDFKEKQARQSLGQMELFPDISGKKNNSQDKNLLLIKQAEYIRRHFSQN